MLDQSQFTEVEQPVPVESEPESKVKRMVSTVYYAFVAPPVASASSKAELRKLLPPEAGNLVIVKGKMLKTSTKTVVTF